MIKGFLLLGGIAVLAAIFIRRYQMNEKGFTPGKLFRQIGQGLRQLRERRGDFDVTIDEMIPSAETIDPKKVLKANTLLKRGEVFLEKGNLAEAAKHFIQCLALDPSNQAAYHKLGLVYLKQEQFGKAEMLYRKLVVVTTEDPSYLSNLALALYQQKKLPEAKTFYQRALELDQSRAGRFFSLGQVLYELQEFEKALEHFQKAVEMEPGSLDYLLTLAQFYLDQGFKKEGGQLLSEILVLYPENEIAAELMRKYVGPPKSPTA